MKIILLFLIYSVCGTLLHFTFKLSKNNIVVGIFSAINESVWEHIKILLTPIFIISFITFVINSNYNFFILLIELVGAISLIILFYEIKTAIFKNKYGIINIISFYITCLLISFLHFALQDVEVSKIGNGLSFIVVIIIFAMYLTFSIFPLKHSYFKDPITGTYGINEYVNKSV
ncbi:MAG: hypothetical protein IKX00_01740 [Bacilli bacterium]|nr:hypothetical protein [Bacilli bacterium]